MSRIIILILFFSLLLSFDFSKKDTDKHSNSVTARFRNDYGNDIGEKIFIENKGQWDDRVLFKAKLRSGDIYIRKEGISFVQMDRSHFKEGGHYHGDGPIKGVRIDFDFINNNASSLKIVPQSKSNFTHNFVNTDASTITAYGYSSVYISNMYDGIDWRIYTTIYGGIKHEFILKPNADPEQIKILPRGHKAIKISKGQLHVDTGYLPIIEKKPETFYTRSGKRIPVSYHLDNDVVSFQFLKKYDKTQSIIIDPELIFSTYSGSTGSNWGFTATFGENGTAYTAGIVLRGGFPVTPGAYQTNIAFAIDIGILKFSSDGSRLLYATYLGGRAIDLPHSLLMDKDNNLLVFGTTSSTDFPTSSGAYQNSLKRESRDRRFVELYLPFSRSTDLFLARLSSDGRRLLHSTLIGGTGIDGINTVLTIEDDYPGLLNGVLSYNYGDSFRGDLAQDPTGNVYITSTTKSRDFPVTQGAYQSTYGGGSSDAVIFKINESFSRLIWSTYVGGNYGENFYNMKLDDNNNIVACGSTISSSSFLPTTGKFKPSKSINTSLQNGFHYPDGFVAKINALTGIVTDATYVGTISYDQLYFVDLDSKGDIFTIGITRSENYPKSAGTYGNSDGGVFIQKLSKDLTTGLLSTRLGATLPSISPTAFLVNKCDDIYITGFSNKDLWATYRHRLSFQTLRFNFAGTTVGLPVSADAFQKETDGKDFYLMILNKDAKEFVYGTYFGGKQVPIVTNEGTEIPRGEHVDGGTNRFDKNGVIYHAVCADCQGINTYPATPNAYVTRNGSANGCNNAVFKFDFSKLKPKFTIRASNNDNTNALQGCVPYTIDILNSTDGSSIDYEWDMGDGTIVTKDSKDPFSYTYEKAGIFEITLTAKTDNSCLGFSQKKLKITVVESDVETAKNTTICPNEIYQLWATNTKDTAWRIKDGAIFSRADKINVTPRTTTTYVVTGNSILGNCSTYKEITVNVIPDVVAGMSYTSPSIDVESPSLICDDLPASLVFKNTSQHGESYVWDFGDGNTTTTLSINDVSHTYYNEGKYNVTITAKSNIACNRSHSLTKTIVISKPINIVEPDISLCKGDKYTLTVSDEIQNIKWYKSEITANNLIAKGSKFDIRPKASTIYYATGKTALGCTFLKKTTIGIKDESFLQFRIKKSTTCTSPMTVQLEVFFDLPDGITANENSKIDATLDMGDNNTYEGTNVSHTYANEGRYIVTMVGQDSKCTVSRTLSVEVPHISIPNVITPNGDSKNDTFFIQGQTQIQLVVFDRWDNKVFESKDYKNDWPQQNTNLKGVYNYEAIIQGGDTCNGWLEIK